MYNARSYTWIGPREPIVANLLDHGLAQVFVAAIERVAGEVHAEFGVHAGRDVRCGERPIGAVAVEHPQRDVQVGVERLECLIDEPADAGAVVAADRLEEADGHI
jgi:hypothetical protein